ncbi:hypothetical protein [Metabacillus indicus]|uniref:hypothetical protein n=1 Tax=Metabacillus indicus TaxID=246786 RepID=UPI00068E301B|nr:hypothetical protein [Metabacillus indicus]
MNRVKFSPKATIIVRGYLDRIEKIFNEKPYSKKTVNINEVIELYNIIKFYDEGNLNEYFIDKKHITLKTEINLIKGFIGQFLHKENATNLIAIFKDVEFKYLDDYWSLINHFKAFHHISKSDFLEILFRDDIFLPPILKNKKIVNFFSNEIIQYMFADIKSAEYILDVYEIIHMTEKEEMFFPSALTVENKEQLIKNYINSADPNINYLRVIKNIQNSTELRISDKTRLEASKRLNLEEEKIFKTNRGLEYSTSVIFKSDQEEAVIYNFSGLNWECIVGMKWLEENSDFNTLLNNFIYIFEYVDSTMLLNDVSKMNEQGTLEQFFLTRTKKSYNVGSIFHHKNFFSTLKMQGYYHQLLKFNVRLEEVFEWFFTKYLSEEFGIVNFRIKLPSKGSSYLEKCRAILPEMESALKQYGYFIEDGYIDNELLHFSSNHLLYKECSSILHQKYIYPSGEEYLKATYLLFSKQCMLSYTPRLKRETSDFFSLLLSEKIKSDEYDEYLVIELKWLQERDYIEIDSQGFLKLKDKIKVMVLHKLYNDEVINYWRVPKEYKTKIDKLLEEGLLIAENKFFNKLEHEYFDYHLNKATFSNSLDLRNMYLHGTQPNDPSNEKIHETNYMTFMKLFAFLIIKINDELCVWKHNNSSRQNDI